MGEAIQIKKGVIIEIDGGKCSGKTTLSKLLYDSLKSDGFDVELMEEPVGSVIAEKIINLAVSEDVNKGLGSLASFFLLMASRAQLIYDSVDRALKDGKVLIFDGYEDSTRVYQGIINNVGLPTVDSVIKQLFSNYRPDITVLLDVKAEISLERSKRCGYNMLPLAYHELVNKSYSEIFFDRLLKDEHCFIVNSNRGIDEVYKDLYSLVRRDLDRFTL